MNCKQSSSLNIYKVSIKFNSKLMDKKLGEEYRLKGNEALIKKNYKDAIDWFTKGLDVLKEASTYSNRAMAYFRMGEY